MKLREFIDNLEALAEEYGDELVTIYGIDEEGNGFSEVVFPPSICNFENGEADFEVESSPNAICVN